jgi:hypothetical protein
MTVDNILAYLEVAKSRGLRQMGITEHDRYLDEIDLVAFQEAREKYQDVELRLGIEIDFVPGAEERMDRDSSRFPTTTSSEACIGWTTRRWITPAPGDLREVGDLRPLRGVLQERPRGGPLRALRGPRSPRPHKDLPALPRPRHHPDA